jgi:hypothetical protein
MREPEDVPYPPHGQAKPRRSLVTKERQARYQVFAV